MGETTNNKQRELKSVTIDKAMAICSNCYHEFDKGDRAFIDKDGDYVCKDCKNKA